MENAADYSDKTISQLGVNSMQSLQLPLITEGCLSLPLKPAQIDS